MTLQDVRRILEANNMPTRSYSFDGAGGGGLWALEKLNSTWIISFYNERGSRDESKVYENEDTASRDYLNIMNTVLQQNQHRSLTIAL